MKKEEYKKFYNLLNELKKMSDKLVEDGYRGHNMELSEGIIRDLTDAKEKLNSELSLIKKIKDDYWYSGESFCRIISDRYYLVWSKNVWSDVALYRVSKGNISSKSLFKGLCGVLTVFPDNDSFILIEKEKSHYNFDFISELWKDTPDKRNIISGVKNWKDLNDNLIIFELIDDKGSAVYDKSSNRILFEGVDSVKDLDEKFGNYSPNKNYLVEKILHFENEDLVLKFFIDKSGNVVSDLFDSNFCLYEIKNRSCTEQVCSTLNQLFREIIEDYKKEGYQLVLKK